VQFVSVFRVVLWSFGGCEKGEGALLREVRLRALQDAPYAFGSWFERELDYAPEVWDDRAAQSDAGIIGAVYVAIEDGRCVGMAGGYFASEDRAAAKLWGMWVDPGARGRGLGRGLVEAVIAWARACGARCLKLSVTDGEISRPAAELYRSLGFERTGERERLDSDRMLVALGMSYVLRQASEELLD
jgi:ribosomal protein S18 acetylase RimI-like enzyme